MAEKRLANRVSPVALIAFSLVLFIGFGIVWWNRIYTDPRHVFDGMLENSLRLNGVSRRVTQVAAGQDLNQISQLSLGGSQQAESNSTLTQGGSESAVVITESIGTPTHDFVRYTSIDTNQTKTDGQPLDFTNVLGVWGNNEVESDNQATNGELYNESVLGIVPFGNLPPGYRSALLKLIDELNVYEVDYSKVTKETRGFRPVLVYPVRVDAANYITLLKQFAALTGLNHLSDLDPAAYEGSEKLQFTFKVDVISRNLKEIVYSDGSRVEQFSGHNAIKNVALPKDTITVDELQTRLQQLQ